MNQYIKSIFLENDKLYILDQRLLPTIEKYIELKNENDVFDAIKSLSVRGAPAIGIVSAYGVYISLNNKKFKDLYDFKEKALNIIDYLSKSRPTAYNLFYALKIMKSIIENANNIDETIRKIKDTAILIHEEDLKKSEKIGENGLKVIPDNANILTHCNAGGLATGGGGTSLAVIFKAKEMGKNIFVYVDETRPLLQGSRLTAWELKKMNIPFKIITDNMAGFLMKQSKIDLVIVGADRIAKNGDFANKIGTYSLAVLSHHHGIPFYTAAPITTFDNNIDSEEQIPIEERNKEEVIYFGQQKVAPDDVDVYNPSFDTIPHKFLTGIITEYSIIYPPFKENIIKLLPKQEKK